MCKQFATQWYTTSFKSDDPMPDYSSTVKPSMTPEKKKLVHEVFSLLGTHFCDTNRTTFDISYVVSIKDNSAVDLKQEVLERTMTLAPTMSADNILATLSTVYQDTTANEQSVNLVEELEYGDLEEARTESISVRNAASNATTANQSEKIR